VWVGPKSLKLFSGLFSSSVRLYSHLSSCLSLIATVGHLLLWSLTFIRGKYCCMFPVTRIKYRGWNPIPCLLYCTEKYYTN